MRPVEFVSKQGYAIKSNKSIKKFQKRWLVLDEDQVRYYKDQDAAQKGKPPKGTIKLVPSAKLQIQADSADNDARKFQVTLPERTFMIIAEDRKGAVAWLEAVKNNLTVLRQRSRLKEQQEAAESWDVFGADSSAAGGDNPMRR